MARSLVRPALVLLIGLGTGPSSQAQFGRGGDPTRLADQLVAESGRFVEEARYELAGTRQGRNLEIRGNALLGAAESYRNELRLRHADDSRRLRAFDGVERSLAEVHREINNPPGTAPRASSSVRRIDRIVTDLRQGIGGGVGGGGSGRPPGFPPTFPPGRPPMPPSVPSGPGYDWRRVAELAESTTLSIQALSTRIDREVGRFHPYDGVLRDLDGMASGLGRVSDLARRQLPVSQLGPILQPVRNQARRTGNVIQGARPPFGISRSWDGIQRGVDDLSRMLGLSGDFVIDPNQPVIIDRPGYEQLPWPSLPGFGGGGGALPPSSRAVPLLDEAIGELDGYLLAIRPNLSAIPEGPQFHRDAQELRNAVVALRQGIASGGWNPSVRRQQAEVDAIAQRLVDRTARVSRGQIGPNNARILRVRDLINEARNLSGPTPY